MYGVGTEHTSIETCLEYAPKDKMFFIRQPEATLSFYPGNVKDFVDQVTIRGHGYQGLRAFVGKTEDEALKKAHDFMKLFEGAKKAIRKVIIYYIDYKSKNIKSPFDRGGWYRGSGAEAYLKIDYKIVTEESIGENVSYYFETKRKFSGETRTFKESASGLVDQCHWKVIEHSEKREEFFRFLYSAMESLISQVQVFTEDQTKLLDSIDGGLKLLEERTQNTDKD